MTAKEIRQAYTSGVDMMREKDVTVAGATIALAALQVILLGEIAAQLAVMNAGNGANDDA